jgi:hypothetical protein
VAFSRLAIIAEAMKAEEGETGSTTIGPNPDTLVNLTRAWRRYQRELYPIETRHQAEFIVSFWGSLLLRSYPEEILTADLARENEKPEAKDNEQLQSAIANKAEFQRALQVLFPAAQPVRLAELPRLSGVGTRIGCLCMLSYVTLEHELADFFISRLNKWQQGKLELPVCRRDLVLPVQTTVRYSARRIFQLARERAEQAEAALNAASSKTRELQETVDKAKAAFDRAQQAYNTAKAEADEAAATRKKKLATVAEAEKLCHVADKPDAPAPQVGLAAPPP